MDSLGGEVVDCVFTECGSTHWEAQGALWMKAGYAGRCLFTKNKASRNGTALYMEGGLVENCLFTENNTAGAHTAYLKNAAVLLNSSVVYNNGTSGSGIQISGQNARVVNCAIFGNVAPSSVTGDTWAGTASGFVRCASGRAIEGGIDCLVGDPAFVDAENGDYRLMPASCCMDAGIDPADYAVASAMDYLKAPRVVGEAVDIGCYENQQDEATVSFLVEYDQFVLPARFEMTPVTMCIPDGATYEWDFGDGTIVTEHAPIPVQHTYVQAGEFTITLTVSFGEETLLSVYPSVFQLSPSVLYVNGGNADAAYPYDTPETGAATVADAVEAAVDGATIIVLRGTLVQSRQVEITKGITLRGETDDPSDVILANDASKINSDNSRIFIVNHPDAMVANLTMTRGSARANNAHGANVYIQAKGGTVSNCVIRSGRTQHFASYGAAVYMDNGLLTHTEITGEYVTVPNYNQDPSNKGVVVHLAGANARMENCLVHDVTLAKSENAPNYYDVSSCGPVVSVDAGMMVNCTIAPNCSAAGTASTDSNFMRYNGGAAIYCGNSGSVYNTVATGLINASGMLRAFSGNAASYHYCAGDAVLEETWAGEQCLFGMPTAFYQDLAAQDYRPNTKSPLIGGGTNAASAEGTDFAGKPRLSGITIDIGCYECNSNYTLLLFR